MTAGRVILAAALALAAPAGAQDAAAPSSADGAQADPVEARFPDLAERITRAKARPGALDPGAAGDEAAPGARAIVVHRNEVRTGFHLESVRYAIDGATVYAKLDLDGDLAAGPEFAVFDGRLDPGAHELQVELVYRGAGEGLNRFHEGQRFAVRAARPFGVTPGQVATIRVAGIGRDARETAHRLAVDVRIETAPDAPPVEADPAR